MAPPVPRRRTAAVGAAATTAGGAVGTGSTAATTTTTTTTVPYTIAEAAEILQQGRRASPGSVGGGGGGSMNREPGLQRSRGGDDGGNAACSVAPVDILGVVSEVDYEQQTLAHQHRTATAIPHRRCRRVWIRDPSLHPRSLAFVSFYENGNSSNCVDDYLHQLFPGDVVRFNGVRMSRAAAAAADDNGSVQIHRFFPGGGGGEDAAPTYIRLGHVSSDGTFIAEDGDSDDQRRRHPVVGIRTDPASVRRVVSWYVESSEDFKSRSLASTGAAVASQQQRQQQRQQQPVLCRQLTIPEFQASAGALGNLTASVVDIRGEEEEIHVGGGVSNKRKRGRAISGGAAATRPRSRRFRAVLSDGRGHSIVFCCEEGGCRSTLEEARETGRPVRLTSILAQRGSNGDDDVVLVATSDTAATLLLPEARAEGVLPRHPADTSQLSVASSSHDGAGNGETNLDECLTQEQQEAATKKKGDATSDNRRSPSLRRRRLGGGGSAVSVEASIRQLTVRNGEGSWLTLSCNDGGDDAGAASASASAADRIVQILEAPDSDLGGLEVRLTLTAATGKEEELEEEAVAGAGILRSLCGGLDPSDLARDGGDGAGSFSTLRGHALRLLVATVKEKVELRWTLAEEEASGEEGSDDGSLGKKRRPFRVVRVKLPCLC